MNRTERIKDLCETALFVAIVFIGVFIIKFPGPFGYAHIGDSMIFLSVLMLGGKRGAVAGGVGAALADIVSGYAVWAVPTLICKAVMALVMGSYQTPCIRTQRPCMLDRGSSSRWSDTGDRIHHILVFHVRQG